MVSRQRAQRCAASVRALLACMPASRRGRAASHTHTGLSEPTEPNGGYGPAGKQFVAGLLRRIQREAWRVARASGLQDSKLIAHARIPVLKLFHRGGIEMDVSFGNTSGIQAATFLQTMVRRAVCTPAHVPPLGGRLDCSPPPPSCQAQITEFQVLKPLVLVLKAVLKQQVGVRRAARVCSVQQRPANQFGRPCSDRPSAHASTLVLRPPSSGVGRRVDRWRGQLEPGQHGHRPPHGERVCVTVWCDSGAGVGKKRGVDGQVGS